MVLVKTNVFSDPDVAGNPQALTHQADPPPEQGMIFESISSRLTELTEIVDGSLAAFVVFLATTRSSLQLGEGISAVMYRTNQLRRQLARLFRMQGLGFQAEAKTASKPFPPDDELRITAQQESFRVNINGINTRLGALRPGDGAIFDTVCIDLRHLLKQIVNYRINETARTARSDGSC
jgi:hypothetical protein